MPTTNGNKDIRYIEIKFWDTSKNQPGAATVPHPQDLALHNSMLENLKNRAIREGNGPNRSAYWSDYYYTEAQYGQIDYGYAITSHKS
jgi:hypothetical protein